VLKEQQLHRKESSNEGFNEGGSSPGSSPVSSSESLTIGDSDNGYDSDDGSEKEWEDWMADLERQPRALGAKKMLEKNRRGSDYDDPGYDGRFLFVTALRELQEERRALEPSGVVTTKAFSTAGSQSSIQTHVTSEFYSSTVRSTTGSRTSSMNVADLSKTMTRSRTSILRNPKSGRSQPSVAEESLQ